MPRVIITVPDKEPQPYRFSLNRKTVAIGRGSDNDIVIDCGSISTHHALMERIPGGFQLRDLNSTNGTKFNGRRSTRIALTDGIHAQLGDVTFAFMLSSEETSALAKERVAAEEPEREPQRGTAPQLHRAKKRKTVGNRVLGCFSFILVLLLAAVAFVVGLTLRYSRDTDRPMVPDLLLGPDGADDFRAKAEALKAEAEAAAEEAPAGSAETPETPAE